MPRERFTAVNLLEGNGLEMFQVAYGRIFLPKVNLRQQVLELKLGSPYRRSPNETVIAEGRRPSLKPTVFNHMNYRVEQSRFIGHVLVIPKNPVK